ncbi:hypothetical protein [Collimonas arenae]|uniref:hypothetical protein n=1 Tax=Collimonas arenae TaxID=279058 RepID=UPI003AAC44E3
MAHEWHANMRDTWQARTTTNILHRLEKDVLRPLYSALINYRQKFVEVGKEWGLLLNVWTFNIR